MTDLARPAPKPTAQVAVYVEVLGLELAMQFLLTYGGSEVYLADDPKGRASHERLLGYDRAKALATVAHRLQRRVPLASRWLAEVLDWQGHSVAHIARTLRVSDKTVRAWLRGKDQRGQT